MPLEVTMKVDELMSAPAIICKEDDSLHVAAGRMRDHDIGALAVVDDVDAIIGVITDRDICLAAHALDRRLRDIPVADITGSDVFTVATSDTIRHAERVMRDNQVRRLPVIGPHDQIVGLLSLHDLARALARETSSPDRARGIGSDELMQTLAAIGARGTRR